MHHAARIYHLGKSKSGKTIFWMIDDMVQPLDGRIEPNTWISTLLKAREPILDTWRVRHCLFGLHLLADRNDPVSIVESERSAIILSEIFPENIWLAVMKGTCFTIDLLKPLQDRKVKVFPHTDATMSNYVSWVDLCDLARKSFHLDISVSTILEDHATDDQKQRGIDLLDFILES